MIRFYGHSSLFVLPQFIMLFISSLFTQLSFFVFYEGHCNDDDDN